MSEKQTISINGRHYDAHSGLAVDTPGIPVTPKHTPTTPASHRATTHAVSVHARPGRSHTLNRKTIKRPQPAAAPAPAPAATQQITPRRNPTLTAHRPTPTAVKHISKFAPHPIKAAKPIMDIGPVSHPHVVKAHAMSKAKTEAPRVPKPVKPQTSHEIKQSAIHNAVQNTNVNHRQPKSHILKRRPRAISIVSASIALVLMGGYLTYLNMPSISVRVAAAQAGISASYPNYKPDGYSLNGTVGYSEGKVTMKFASNGGPQSFAINQTKSNWDSAAVLDNYVSPRAGASYIPYTERGLTIYTYGNSAAWVNGGILYTIEGDAPLSSEQIRRIATSLI